ncbi:DUF1700 domain-containing protein [Feifania hominis]|uniref:DUF1700 domain-containing protein n=1 Tax=Feifania hominis TaxID=2763660 RepID=A0A926DDY2_9FIRM|nr:DUF1700 domain-containing protein [Feifania hominis]MBC8535260.1 DUF1700 domain-containing protein [Feifania hominis]
MTRAEYFIALERELRALPEEEQRSALLYYAEYFDDAGPEREQEVMAELGAPEQVAAQIMTDFAVKSAAEAPAPPVKKGLSTVWMVILAIFAAPIALPLALAGAIVVLALLLVVFVLIVAFFAVCLALFAASIAAAILGLTALPAHPPTAIALIGAGLVVFAVGILLTMPTIWFARLSVSGVARLGSKLLVRRRVKA